jgi:hypothetical protein
MNPFQFLKQLNSLPRGDAQGGGDGIRVKVSLAPFDLSTAAGLGLTGATVPAIVANEVNDLVVSCVAGQTAAGSFKFVVPQHYDEVADEVKIDVLVVSGGNTDTPTLTATAYRKRAGAAITAALTVVASAAIPNSTAKAAVRTITLSGNSLKAGDTVMVNLVTAAHATDAVFVSSVEVQHKSGIVFNNPSLR